MALFTKKRLKPQFSRQRAFQSIPLKNPDVREETQENGNVLLSCPVGMRPLFAKAVSLFGGDVGKIRMRRIQLDELGSEVWRLLDGQRTVAQIIRQFAKHHQVHKKEAEVAVTQFIRDLGRRGLIGIK